MRHLLGVGCLLVVAMAALSAAELLPWVGPFFRELRPIGAFFVYFGLGWLLGSADSGSKVSSRGALLCVGLIFHLVLYSMPMVVGYYSFPIKIASAEEKSDGKRPSYDEAAVAGDRFLEQQTGLSGVPAYAIYSTRQSLLADGIQKQIDRQFESVDGPVGCAVALLNVILYIIPIALKALLVNKLEVLEEPAYIGLVFWYLVTLAFTYYGYRKETA